MLSVPHASNLGKSSCSRFSVLTASPSYGLDGRNKYASRLGIVDLIEGSHQSQRFEITQTTQGHCTRHHAFLWRHDPQPYSPWSEGKGAFTCARVSCPFFRTAVKARETIFARSEHGFGEGMTDTPTDAFVERL